MVVPPDLPASALRRHRESHEEDMADEVQGAELGVVSAESPQEAIQAAAHEADLVVLSLEQKGRKHQVIGRSARALILGSGGAVLLIGHI